MLHMLQSSTTFDAMLSLIYKSKPSTLTELKAVVEAFAESVDPEEVKRSARSTWKRARACRAVAGRRTSVICSETVKWDHFL